MKSIFRAWYLSDAGNEFSAYAETEEQANVLLLTTMESYGTRNGLAKDWWVQEDPLGVNFMEIQIGAGYVDDLVYMARQ
jgi:hypothetical protein